MDHSPSIVEFVGLSGAGKSTVAAQLVILLRSEGYTVSTRTELLGDLKSKWQRHLIRGRIILSEVVRAPSLFLTLVPRILASRQRRVIDFPKLLWNFWSVCALILRHRRRGRGILVMDQGVFQAIWSVGYLSRESLIADQWHSWLQRFDLHDVNVVEAQVPVDVARERLIFRCGGRCSNSRAAYLSSSNDWMRLQVALNATTMVARKQVFPGRFIAIDTSVKSSAKDLSSQLLAHLLAVKFC